MEKEKRIKQVLDRFGIKALNDGVSTGAVWYKTEGDVTSSVSPIDGKEIAKVKNATIKDYEAVIKKAEDAFRIWREVPAPQRGVHGTYP